MQAHHEIDDKDGEHAEHLCQVIAGHHRHELQLGEVGERQADHEVCWQEWFEWQVQQLDNSQYDRQERVLLLEPADHERDGEQDDGDHQLEQTIDVLQL